MNKGIFKRTISIRKSMAALAFGLGIVGLAFPTVTKASEGAEQGSVAIDENTFPDDYFRNYIKEEIDINGDDVLSEDEIASCKTISALADEVSSLQGIEIFTNLRSLDCYETKLTSLDLSENKKLVKVYCQGNKLTSIDVSGCTKLKELYVIENNLKSLDLSNNTALETLDCSSNKLTSLNVENNTALETLNCSSNKLTALNVENNSALENLYCGSNNLKELNVKSNIALENLECEANELTELDISGNAKLISLYCGYNNLENLDISSNKELDTLNCASNELTKLDVSNNVKLTSLKCSSNYIKTLDITNNRITWIIAGDETYVYGNVESPTTVALSNASTGIKVTWNKVSGVSGYIVYRRKAGGAWSTVKIIPGASVLSYIDTAVNKSSGVEYSYMVGAYKVYVDETKVRSPLDGKAKSISRISQVTLQTPESTSNGVKVKWSKVAGATGYIVYRKSSTEKNWTKIAQVQGNAKVSYLDTKAKTNGAKYAYTVKAYSDTVTGSANQTGKALYYVAPTSLTGLKNAASKSVTVKWKKNAKATGYQVQYSTSEKFTGAKTVTVKGSASITKTLSKLTKGKTYYVRVRSYKKGASANYFSAWSAAKKVKVSK